MRKKCVFIDLLVFTSFIYNWNKIKEQLFRSKIKICNDCQRELLRMYYTARIVLSNISCIFLWTFSVQFSNFRIVIVILVSDYGPTGISKYFT